MSNYFVREMNRKYGIPYADSAMPVGIEFTATWVRDVSKIFGKEKQAEKVIAEEEARTRPKLDELKEELKGKRAYIGFNLARSVGLQSLLQELGIETVVTTGFEYSDDYGLKAFESLNKRCKKNYIVHIGNFQHFEWVNLFRREKPDLLVGGIEHASSALRAGIPVAAVLPDTFYCGYEGATCFGIKIEKALKNKAFPTNLSKHVKNPYKEGWYSENPFKYIGGDGQ
jgi:nitrogenase molybdenum-iron protein alpha chain